VQGDPTSAGREASGPAKVYPRHGLGGAERPLFLELLRVFATRLKVFLAVVAIVIVGTVYHTMRATPIYRASSQILIERQTPRMDNLNDLMVVDTSEGDYYNTQVTILEGPGLATRVAKAMPLHEHPEFKEAGAEDAGMAGLEVVWLRNNRVVEIGF
jgi:uncharacterized protein involved in exopolysaccharide biosynthesis